VRAADLDVRGDTRLLRYSRRVDHVSRSEPDLQQARYGERVALFEFEDKHGFFSRAAARGRRALAEPLARPKGRAIKEGTLARVQRCRPAITRSGQVLEDFKGKSVFHFNMTVRRCEPGRWRPAAPSSVPVSERTTSGNSRPPRSAGQGQGRDADPRRQHRAPRLSHRQSDLRHGPGVKVPGLWFTMPRRLKRKSIQPGS